MNKTQIYKTDAQHRNLKDKQRGSHKKTAVNPCASER